MTDARVQRIIQIARHVGPGAGVAQVVFSLEAAFARRGIATSRYTLKDSGLAIKTPVSNGAATKLFLLVEVLWFSIVGSLTVRRLRNSDPNALIIAHGDPIGGDIYVNHGLIKQVVRLRKRRRCAIPLNPMHWFTLLRDEIRYASRVQNTIVCLNHDDETTLRTLYPRLKSPVEVIPNGVDLTRFKPDATTRSIVRAAHSIPDSARVLLFVGNEFDRKGLHLALDALSRLPTHVRLLVVGGTPSMLVGAQRRAEFAGVTSRVIFAGVHADSAPFYRAADLLVLPSAYETGPLVVPEALASGIQCVVTRVGIAPYVITPGVNGELVSRHPDAIAEGIRSALARVDDNAESTRAACVASAQMLSWDAIAERYLQVADSLRGQ